MGSRGRRRGAAHSPSARTARFATVILGVALALAVAPVGAQSLSKGAQVRVQVADFGADWHNGAVGVSPASCTMVYLT